MSVTFIITGKQVHLSFAGKHVVVTDGDRNYAEVRQLIKDGKKDEIPAIFERKELTVEEYIDGSGLVLVNGALKDASGEKLPAVLSQRMIALKEDGFPVDALVKFWENLKTNPSMNSREQLYKFLEQNGHPITDSGEFIAYRGVRADFKDIHSGTFDNSPGSVCEMPREKVDDNPNRTCSAGLHVAAFEYANGFGPITVEVKVNPRDVVAVPTDYNGQKMRVCRFEVVQECKSEQSSASLYNYSYDHVNWDGDDEKNYDEYDAGTVLAYAQDFKDRYTDRTMLAARIEEEVEYLDITQVDILEILNDNESDWK